MLFIECNNSDYIKLIYSQNEKKEIGTNRIKIRAF
jgi:hypothetical protein